MLSLPQLCGHYSQKTNLFSEKKKCFHDNLPQQTESKGTLFYITWLFLVLFVAMVSLAVPLISHGK